MFVDFGMAQQYGGVCYLRYDDTNPEAEKLEYIQHIEEIVAWMGWKPWKITYSSDYFQVGAWAVVASWPWWWWCLGGGRACSRTC